jgi:hypothetical protein
MQMTSPSSGLDLWTVQFVASRYTDYATLNLVKSKATTGLETVKPLKRIGWYQLAMRLLMPFVVCCSGAVLGGTNTQGKVTEA